jgi:type IV pilus assembly protein PilX
MKRNEGFVKHGCAAAVSRQSGMVLILALIALAALTISALALQRSTDTGNLIAGNTAFKQAALQDGNLGLEAGVTGLQALISAGTTGSDSNNGNYRATFNPAADYNTTALTAALPSTNVLDRSAVTGNRIRYLIERMCSSTGAASASTCRMTAGGNPLYRITARVDGPRDTLTLVQAVVDGGGAFNPECAVSTKAKLTISGTMTLSGNNRCVQSNDDVQITQKPNNMKDVYATGTVGQSDKLNGATPHPNTPAIGLPTIAPASFQTYARYWLKANGEVWDQQNNTRLAASGVQWKGWKKSGDKWEQESSNPEDGFYYIEGDAIIKDVGTSGDPWNVTIVATRHIEVPGTPYLRDYKNPANSPPQGYDNLFLVAGCDLVIKGDAKTNVNGGIMAAGDDVQVSGNPTLNGFIFATNVNCSHSLADENKFSGNVNLTFNGNANFANPWGGNAARLAWREVYQ